MTNENLQKGYLVIVKYKDNTSRILLFHTLFGRMSYKKGGKNIGYYNDGILANIPYTRIKDKHLFVSEKIKETFPDITAFKELLNSFGETLLEETTTDTPIQTAIEFYQKACQERGFNFVRRNRKKSKA